MVSLVEFTAKVKQGIIEIPEEYQTNLTDGSEVKVAISLQNEQGRELSLMDRLAQNPISVKGLAKLTRDEINYR
ncbi:hypothetical protein [Limnofasciculus baicalensis]|uniref:Uncharacterized protein n=1 Tax=Limnofasciculus baicalensis BBK-W-15 TaxID=2699891 RepID=A0AAE3GTP3_9CYAN|nr:hypothetical protein [Limnofasciculus baicalensis]MCP2730149.1 hypothetical protein [Limnofasciculus baicalensis BBK-W-15]